jgi:pantetheine-phosphate adenylyltransferase
MIMKTAIYPGTFDPFTNGHDDILRRALRVFDKVIILVAVSPVKRSLFTQDQRVEMINDHLSDEPKASVDSWDGLIVDYAKKHKINAIVRGLRPTGDFEMEFQMASMNNHLYEEIDTFFLPTGGKHYFVSSSLVKELHKNGRDIAEFIPESVLKYIKAP